MTLRKNFATGDVWVETDCDYYVGEMRHLHYCRVNNSVSIGTSNGSWTLITFDSERADSQSMHSTSSNMGRLYAPEAGEYIFGVHARFGSNATGYRAVMVRLNAAGSSVGGTELAQDMRTAVSGTYTHVSLTTTYALAANDYVEFFGFQNSGGSLDVEAHSNTSPEAWMKCLGKAI